MVKRHITLLYIMYVLQQILLTKNVQGSNCYPNATKCHVLRDFSTDNNRNYRTIRQLTKWIPKEINCNLSVVTGAISFRDWVHVKCLFFKKYLKRKPD